MAIEYSRINEDFPDEKLTSLEVMTKLMVRFMIYRMFQELINHMQANYQKLRK